MGDAEDKIDSLEAAEVGVENRNNGRKSIMMEMFMLWEERWKREDEEYERRRRAIEESKKWRLEMEERWKREDEERNLEREERRRREDEECVTKREERDEKESDIGKKESDVCEITKELEDSGTDRESQRAEGTVFTNEITLAKSHHFENSSKKFGIHGFRARMYQKMGDRERFRIKFGGPGRNSANQRGLLYKNRLNEKSLRGKKKKRLKKRRKKRERWKKKRKKLKHCRHEYFTRFKEKEEHSNSVYLSEEFTRDRNKIPLQLENEDLFCDACDHGIRSLTDHTKNYLPENSMETWRKYFGFRLRYSGPKIGEESIEEQLKNSDIIRLRANKFNSTCNKIARNSERKDYLLITGVEGMNDIGEKHEEEMVKDYYDNEKLRCHDYNYSGIRSLIHQSKNFMPKNSKEIRGRNFNIGLRYLRPKIREENIAEHLDYSDIARLRAFEFNPMSNKIERNSENENFSCADINYGIRSLTDHTNNYSMDTWRKYFGKGLRYSELKAEEENIVEYYDYFDIERLRATEFNSKCNKIARNSGCENFFMKIGTNEFDENFGDNIEAKDLENDDSYSDAYDYGIRSLINPTIYSVPENSREIRKTKTEDGLRYNFVSGLEIGDANTPNDILRLRATEFNETILKKKDYARTVCDMTESLSILWDREIEQLEFDIIQSNILRQRAIELVETADRDYSMNTDGHYSMHNKADYLMETGDMAKSHLNSTDLGEFNDNDGNDGALKKLHVQNRHDGALSPGKVRLGVLPKNAQSCFVTSEFQYDVSQEPKTEEIIQMGTTAKSLSRRHQSEPISRNLGF